MSQQQELFDRGRPSLPGRVLAYASGVNEAREIRGFALAAIPVGFSVALLREEAMAELLRSTLPLFADSGAFSQRPITHGGWLDRLARYMRLAEAHGPRLSVVAPDRVGDQEETLRLVGAYRGQVASIALTGARVLLPLQTGRLSAAAFLSAAQAIAGISFVPALPMKKAAMSLGAAFDFVRTVRPERVHLLGMGYQTRAAKRFVGSLLELDGALTVSLDSNRLRAVTGALRPLTRKERVLRSSAPESLYGEVEHTALDMVDVTLDYTEMIAFPSLWADEAMLTRIATDGFSCTIRRQAFIADPDGFLQEEVEGIKVWERPEVAWGLDQAWEQWITRRIDGAVRTAAIRDIFTGNQIACNEETSCIHELRNHNNTRSSPRIAPRPTALRAISSSVGASGLRSIA